ncbi:ABC transporter substrate-binding protein [Streptomyces shenzhenensis]
MNLRNRLGVGVVIAAVTTLSIAGCSSGGTVASGGTGSNKKLVFIQGEAPNNFYISMKCGVESAAKRAGYTVTTQGGQKFDPTLQLPIVQSVLANKPTALIIAPTDTSALQQPLQQAVTNGTKLVLVDTTLDTPSIAFSSIASDNKGGGAAAFQAIKKLAPNGGKVLVIDNQPGISTSQERTQGFADGVKTDPKFKNLGVQYAQDDSTKAAQVVSAALQRNRDIVGIFATNVHSAVGAATGVQQAGKTGKVQVVTFDAGPDQVSALKDGTIQALIAQQPEKIGEEGAKAAIAALEGKPFAKNIATGFSIITKADLNSPTSQAALYKTSCS